MAWPDNMIHSHGNTAQAGKTISTAREYHTATEL
jgi:hypothetical protein